MIRSGMPKLFRYIFPILFLIFISCSQKKVQNNNDFKFVYDTWVEFQQKKDMQTCRKFISVIDAYEIETFNSYPELKAAAKNQIETCRTTALLLLEQPENMEYIQTINLCLLEYIQTQNYVLEDTHNKFFTFFMWLLATIISGGVILIYLNAREIKKRDQIIYNSEQFLKHSMEVQEAERRRISFELHDTVAQSMRYVSFLAEGIKDKEIAQQIISNQNQNIEDIRKLCYNLTPPSISDNDMFGALETLGEKTFDIASKKADQSDNNFQLRIVIEEDVDFSKYNDEQLMNIYRIVQESFMNIKKHAKASEVTVLFKQDKKLKLIITDDGCGMDEGLVNAINNGSFTNIRTVHFGIRNIIERVQLLGGSLIYRSEQDCGTQIIIVF